MANQQGMPIWYELMTSDPDAAQDYYARVLGWSIAPMSTGGGVDYRIIRADGEGVGGMMKAPDGGPEPTWLIYIGVDDVDATAARAEELGGAVHMGPTDIPEVGRFAFLGDPQGALFYVMRGSSDQPSNAFAPTAAGHATWNELSTSDQDGAQDFYAALFGWRENGAMPMPGLGDYRFLQHGDLPLGATMPLRQGRSRWSVYWRVPDIEVALARAVEGGGGGRVVSGPHDVPGGDRVGEAIDPQGARFGLVASGR